MIFRIIIAARLLASPNSSWQISYDRNLWMSVNCLVQQGER
jgi:hypothetical protein